MKKIIVSICVIGLLLSMAPLSMGGKEDRTIIYVDDDNTEGPWDGTLEHPYQFIQDGIDVTSDGDTVYVYNGTYYENVIVDKSINLIGENRDTTIIDADNSGSVVEVLSDHVNISGFNIRYGGQYIFSGIEILSDYNIVKDNRIVNNSGWGIRLLDSSYNLIANNSMKDIFCYLKIERATHNIIENNTLTASDSWPYLCNGIWLTDSSTNNAIQSNKIYNIDFVTGIKLDFNSHNNIVKQNIIHNNPSDEFANSIQISDSDFNIISENEIKNNYGSGIAVFYSMENQIVGNIIENLTSRRATSGIGIGFVECRYNNSVKYNKISFTYIAIRIAVYSFENNFISNNLINNTYGFLISGTDSGSTPNNIIYKNNIVENIYGIYIENSSLYGGSNDLLIYHNNFINNNQNAYDECNNIWDNGYPSGGNYWDDYTGVDNYHGPNQDIPSGDGIGDTPYNITNGYNQDSYPLMSPDGWMNEPPNIPTIDGPTSGKVGVEYDYTFVATDPEEYGIYYWIDWGDGNNTSWIGPYISGEEVTVSYSWSEQGTYTISAKAKDTRGAESDWRTLSVTMPLNQPGSQQGNPQSNPSSNPNQQISQQSSNQLLLKMLQRVLLNIR